jgi:NADH-quinone oxidoreductase subunit N
MASATKAAAFAALARVLFTGLDAYRSDWRPAVWALAVLTLAVGNLAALAQRDVKRLLAYSSVAHAGFILIGIEAANQRGRAAALFYLATYALMVLGTFGVLAALARRGERFDLERFAGLGRRRPVLAGALTVLLLAQAGVPATSGFVAKLGVFQAAAQARSWALLVVGVLTAVVGVAYYLRVLLVMYTGAADGEERGAEGGTEGSPELGAAPVGIDAGTGIVLAAAVAATLWFGVAPGGLLDLADRARLLF